jgi:hypothetical protein
MSRPDDHNDYGGDGKMPPYGEYGDDGKMPPYG